MTAGRDPREIRRLLNLGGRARGVGRAVGGRAAPARRWRTGSRTFILAGDDERALAVFGQELAPALREAVAAERTRRRHDDRRGAPGGRTGQAASRASTTTGCPASLVGKAVEPGDRGYGRGALDVRLRRLTRARHPRARRAQDVSDAAACSRARRTCRSPSAAAVTASAAGRRTTAASSSTSGRSTRSRCSTTTAGSCGSAPGRAGATSRPRSRRTGLAISSGDYGDVGVGGLVTAGGQGFLARSYGLTLDHVVAAELVLADGRSCAPTPTTSPTCCGRCAARARTSASSPRSRSRPPHVGDVVYATIVYDASDTASFLVAWAELVEASPRELTSFLTMIPAYGQNPAIGYAIIVWADDDTEAAVASLEQFLDLAPVLQQQAQLVPYSAAVAPHHGEHTGGAGLRGARRPGRARHARARGAARRARRSLACPTWCSCAPSAVRSTTSTRGHGVRAPDAELLAVRVDPGEPACADRRVVGAAGAAPRRGLPELRDEPVPRPHRPGVPARDAGQDRAAQGRLRPRPRVRPATSAWHPTPAGATMSS